MKYPKCCKGCAYLSPTYGNKDKTGKRVVSSYSCCKKSNFALATKDGCAAKKTK